MSRAVLVAAFAAALLILGPYLDDHEAAQYTADRVQAFDEAIAFRSAP